MNHTPYIDMVNGRLRRVGCMKCNRFLYDVGDKVSMQDAERAKLPHRVPMMLSDGSYTDLVLCHSCDVVDADIPHLERTMKYGWMYEFVKAGRATKEIIGLATRIRATSILGRKQ